MKKKKYKLIWKKYWLCGIPLFTCLFLGAFITTYFNYPGWLFWVFNLVGADITFRLIEKFALEEIE